MQLSFMSVYVTDASCLKIDNPDSKTISVNFTDNQGNQDKKYVFLFTLAMEVCFVSGYL